MHGFLNVLLAGVFASVENLDEETMQPILLNEDPSAFVFEDQAVRWQETTELAPSSRGDGGFGSTGRA